ncbi:MAG: hypothetical protein LW688_06680 [Cryomorphaceae bacterium]|jgi:hypothetical protein|nr:hypothetical protein [Cryomorphaceae bacterium]
MKKSAVFFFVMCVCGTFFGQKKVDNRYAFVEHGLDAFGFSSPETDFPSLFDTLYTKQGRTLILSQKSVAPNTQSTVLFRVRSKISKEKKVFKFEESISKSQLDYSILNDSTLLVYLKPSNKSYTVDALSGALMIGKLKVNVLQYQEEKLVIVPLVKTNLNKDTLGAVVNKIFKQACLQLNIDVQPLFNELLENMANPLSKEQYTDQMKALRDAYFEAHPQASKKVFYIFLTPPFMNGIKKGFSVNGKALAFIPSDTGKVFYRNLTQLLARTIGYLEPTTLKNNLMTGEAGVHLGFQQWEQLRHNSHSYSYYDNYEDVKTNNGSVAFYFWKENRNGEILLEDGSVLEAIYRPFKKNEIYYHLNIDELLFYTLVAWRGFALCTWHVLSILLIFPTLLITRRIILKWIIPKVEKPSFWKIASGWMVLILTVCLNYTAFGSIDKGLSQFEVKSGVLKELTQQDIAKFSSFVSRGETFSKRSSKRQLSQVFYLKNGNWYLKKRKRVLYFDAVLKGDSVISLKHTRDSDLLELKKVQKKVTSHYIVVTYRDEAGTFIEQKVFNHPGVELTDKIQLPDPPKRILVFINGYRPVTSGHDFESFFSDLEKKGIESPNSGNLIYSNDRYEYWNRWNKIDSRFKSRINPSDTYYADGHFSVETSNFGSILNFTTVATVYPKRCPNPKKHTCYHIKMLNNSPLGNQYTYTFDLLKNSFNRKGFKLRVKNGKIAGRNLLQALNEFPNGSTNDTIFLVAHSMGFAYSLGMIQELREKINFGGFYIIAPENASCGRVTPSEWQEIWHYGVNFDPGKEDPPCLQDGIAPQYPIKGLTQYRAFFPKDLYRKKGFYMSHFVGNYTWILDIPKGQKGYIRQR